MHLKKAIDKTTIKVSLNANLLRSAENKTSLVADMSDGVSVLEKSK